MEQDYVTKETAKLLYEVGYPQGDSEYQYEILIGLCGKEYLAKPTVAQAIKYLDSEGIIVLPVYKRNGKWEYLILSEKHQILKSHEQTYPTRELALEAGVMEGCKFLER